MSSFVELCCYSHYSLLEGASSPKALIARAKALNLPALGLVDRNGLYAASTFYRLAKESGIKPIIGATLTLDEGDEVILLAESMEGYETLSGLITSAYDGRPKGEPLTTRALLASHTQGLICLIGSKGSLLWKALQRGDLEGARALIARFASLFSPHYLYIVLAHHKGEGEGALLSILYHLAKESGLPLLATNLPLYASKGEAPLADLLTCTRHRTTLREARTLLAGNQERYLKGPGELSPFFERWQEALASTAALAERCAIDLNFSSYRFPDFPLPPGKSAERYLEELTLDSLPKRYPCNTELAREKLAQELSLIAKLNLSGYFLIVWDIMEFARRRGIVAQGRGSAANSLVAYLLGITPVDPIAHSLFLGRFLHEEMKAIPDIDIDFAAARVPGAPCREEVIQYIYNRYGKEHVAMVATFVTFQGRSAIREVGRVLEMPPNLIAQMAKFGGHSAEHTLEELATLKPIAPFLASKEGRLFASLLLALSDTPRHLSIHVGGMLIASKPLSRLVPLEPARMAGRVVCQWDKDMVDDAGLIKVDILSLGMLALLSEATALAGSLENLTYDDPAVYQMISEGDTIGIFQVESRAQMQSLPRTRPQNLSELAVQVAIIRPGPLQGKMVSPYIRRKQGKEPVAYPHPCLEPILKETLGVILFQEQVLQAAVAMAAFTPAQADALRRAMSRKRSVDEMEHLRKEFLTGARKQGIPDSAAQDTFSALQGFALYGFCKSHALSFASIAYKSAYLKLYYPALFTAALLNNQPMGFYPIEVVIEDALRRGVSLLPVDINTSSLYSTLEGSSVRLGLVTVKGVKDIAALLPHRPFHSLSDLLKRAPLDDRSLEALIIAGALDTLQPSRRSSLWHLFARPRQKPLLPKKEAPPLPHQSDWRKVVDEMSTMGLSTTAHPLALLRHGLTQEGFTPSIDLLALPNHARVKVAGLLICRQRPPTAKGFAFLTLEDEGGLMNVILTPPIYEAYRIPLKTSPILAVYAKKQAQDGLLNLLAYHICPVNVV